MESPSTTNSLHVRDPHVLEEDGTPERNENKTEYDMPIRPMAMLNLRTNIGSQANAGDQNNAVDQTDVNTGTQYCNFDDISQEIQLRFYQIKSTSLDGVSIRMGVVDYIGVGVFFGSATQEPRLANSKDDDVSNHTASNMGYKDFKFREISTIVTERQEDNPQKLKSQGRTDSQSTGSSGRVQARSHGRKSKKGRRSKKQNSKKRKRKTYGKRRKQEKLNDLWGIVDTFRYMTPALVNAHVFPVSRRQSDSERSRETQENPSTQSSLPEPSQQWPPESAHGLTWPTFRRELYRMGTFADIPVNSPFFAVRLAQAGFLRLPDGVIVCYFCGLRHRDWAAGDSPLEVHRRLRGDCPLMAGGDCENEPVGTLSVDVLQQLMEVWRLSGPPLVPLSSAALSPAAMGTSQPGSASASQSHHISQPTNSLAHSPARASSSQLGASSQAALETETDSQPAGSSGAGFQASAPAEGQVSTASSASAASHIVVESSGGAQAAGAAVQGAGQQPRPAQPRLGLLGGDAANAAPAANNRITDGTAQPEGQPRGAAGSDARAGQQVVTYNQLGIVTDAPKRPDMAMVNSRVGSFRNWPEASSHTPLQLSEAGFFYAGYADCGRCFHCGGGLKNWEPVDNPWVEHARWFPKCVYVRQCQGQDFIDVIQEMNTNNRRQISLEEVRELIGQRRSVGDQIQEPVVDPAISSVMELGVSQEAVDAAVARLHAEGHMLTADRLHAALSAAGEIASGGGAAADIAMIHDSELGEIAGLVVENSEIRQQRQCKICLDRDSCIVFLPCGHLVCCAQCAPALKHCPMCRQKVRGRVRAFPA